MVHGTGWSSRVFSIFTFYFFYSVAATPRGHLDLVCAAALWPMAMRRPARRAAPPARPAPARPAAVRAITTHPTTALQRTRAAAVRAGTHVTHVTRHTHASHTYRHTHRTVFIDSFSLTATSIPHAAAGGALRQPSHTHTSRLARAERGQTNELYKTVAALASLASLFASSRLPLLVARTA